MKKRVKIKCSYEVTSWELEVLLDEKWNIMEVLEVISTDDIWEINIKYIK